MRWPFPTMSNLITRPPRLPLLTMSGPDRAQQAHISPQQQHFQEAEEPLLREKVVLNKKAAHLRLPLTFHFPRPSLATSSPLKPYTMVQRAVSWFPRNRCTCCGAASFHARRRSRVSRPQEPLSTKSPLKMKSDAGDGYPATLNLWQWIVENGPSEGNT